VKRKALPAATIVKKMPLRPLGKGVRGGSGLFGGELGIEDELPEERHWVDDERWCVGGCGRLDGVSQINEWEGRIVCECNEICAVDRDKDLVSSWELWRSREDRRLFREHNPFQRLLHPFRAF
jgi:hypothetical protein